MENCVTFNGKPPFIPVDNWIIEKEDDELLKQCKGSIYVPISRSYGLSDDDRINYFILSPKKCYNSDDMRVHTCKYLNYFEKFYDKDLEYISVLSRIKVLIDVEPLYNQESFMSDLYRYIMSPQTSGLFGKIQQMVMDNYYIHLKYKNPKNPALEYTDDHGRMLMHMSIVMNMCIPLLTHYAYINKVESIDDFLIQAYDMVLTLFDTDIFAKLYETSYTNIKEKQRNDEELWAKQDIRGIDPITHAQSAVRNIILNIMPKYVFNSSVISLNFVSIKNSNKYTIDIEYEYNYIPLSSSKRDEDAASDFDRFEAYLIKQNEALYIQNTTNAIQTMKQIDTLYGPFSNEEINFYLDKLGGYDAAINPFQKKLIFNIFYRYFGDTVSADAINRIDYVKLMIAAKRILKNNCMIIMPYIISSKVERLINKKAINKKDMAKLEASPSYRLVLEKYPGNEKVINEILSQVATILSSDFTIIDYDDQAIDGKSIEVTADILFEEFCLYVLLI